VRLSKKAWLPAACCPDPCAREFDKLEGANETSRSHRILSRSIEEPLRQIVENAGDDPAVISTREGRQGLLRLQRGHGEFGDMLEAGILDPTKVTRPRVAERGSVAGLC